MATPVAVLVRGADGLRVVAVSAAFSELFQLGLKTLVGRRVEDAFPPVVSTRLLEAAGKPEDSERLIVELKGRGRVSMTLFLAGDRLVLQAERLSRPRKPSLTRRTALLQTLRLVNRGVTYTYSMGREIDFDFAELVGLPANHPAAQGRKVLSFLHPEDGPLVELHQRRLAHLEDGAQLTVLVRLKHLSGEWRWVEAHERVLDRTPKGRPRRILGFVSDVSERHHLLSSLKAASHAVLRAEAKERRRIARELHDSMSQQLVGIGLMLASLEDEHTPDHDRAESLTAIREALNAAIVEIRALSYLLHPPELDRLGFESSLRMFITGFARRTRLNVELHIADPLTPLDPKVELALFRVTQEALMNAHKHAHAEKVEVRLMSLEDAVVLEIADQGNYRSASEIDQNIAHEPGVGIAGMRSRIEEIGGRINLFSNDQGFVVQAILPRPWGGDL